MNRIGFIGGSDCVKIMQGNWLHLWQVKTERAESEDLSGNIAVQLGIWTEDFNLKWFEQENNAEITDQQRTFAQDIEGVPVRGTIDGVWGKSIVEAKHTNPRKNMDDVISYYMPQIQTYAYLAKARGIHMSVIFGNSKWESAYVAFDQDYFNSMWAVVSSFWGYVIRDEEPVGIDTPSINIDKIKVDNMVRRDASADNHFTSAAHDYLENQSAAKSFEIAKKDLKSMVGPNEREVYSDIISIKRSKNGALRFTPRV